MRVLRVLVLLSTALVLRWTLQAAFPEEGAWRERPMGGAWIIKLPSAQKLKLQTGVGVCSICTSDVAFPASPAAGWLPPHGLPYPSCRPFCLPRPAARSVLPGFLLPTPTTTSGRPPWAGQRLDVVFFCVKCTL